MEKASVSFNGHECFKTSETIRFFFEKYDQLMIFIPPQISEGIRKKIITAVHNFDVFCPLHISEGGSRKTANFLPNSPHY